MAPSFTHLHALSGSWGSSGSGAHAGAGRPGAFAAAAQADGATALAYTPRDGLHGAVEYIAACLEFGLSPIVGMELTVLAETDDAAAPHPGAGAPRRGTAGEAGRVVVLAHGRDCGAGWSALCRLASMARAHTGRRGSAAVPAGVLRSELAAGCLDEATGRPVLTVLLGPDSDVGRALGGRRFLRPRTLFRDWLEAMPAGVLAVELVTHGSAEGQPFSTSHAVRLLRLAAEHGVPPVLTNAARRAREDAADAADAPDTPLSEPSRPAWLKPASHMERLGGEIIEAAGLGPRDLAELLSNTGKVAERCRLDPAADLGWGVPVAPESSAGGTRWPAQRELGERARAGLGRRYPGLAGREAAPAEERLAAELAEIDALGLSDQVLALAEAVAVVRGTGVRAAARGPAAESVLAYALGISSVDPVRSPVLEPAPGRLAGDRLLPGGIVLDVEADGLRRVYRALAERFGAARVALVGCRERGDDGADGCGDDGADAEGGRRPGLPDWAGSGGQLELPGAPTAPRRGGAVPPAARACGVVLGDARLLDRIPVEPTGAGLPPLSQFDAADARSLGLLTLGLRGEPLLGALAHAVRELARVHGSREAVAAAGHHGPSGAVAAYIDEDGVIDLDAAPLDGMPHDPVPSGSPVARQAAWLRGHHPEAFLAGLIEHGLHPQVRQDVMLLPADVNASGTRCRLEQAGAGSGDGRLGVRRPLSTIRGLSAGEAARLVEGQPYTDVADLRDRARISPAALARLAEAGALGSLSRGAGRQQRHGALLADLAAAARSRGAAMGPRAIAGQLVLEIGDGAAAGTPATQP